MTRRRSPGPARSLPRRAGRLVRGAAAFCALAGFTGAIPAVLAHYGGWPLPRQVPAWPQVRAALMTPLTESAILKILACAVWLAWAMFAVSLAVEIIAALRGCPAPRMPVFPGAQALAAALVSALTVTAAAVPYSSASLAPAAAASSVAVTTASFRQPGHQAPVRLSAPWITGSPVNSAGAGAQAHPQDTSGSSTALPEIHHVVRGDNLWDIAGADLGNPEQWHEIYALNRARPQADGRSLTDPDRIYPGWALLLPPLPPRSAAPMRPAAPPEHPASPAAAGHPPGSSHSQHAPGRHRPADRQSPGKASTSTAHPGARKGATGIHLPGGGLAGITLAAAVSAAAVLAGVQRSRRYRPGKTATSSLLPGNPPLPAAIATLRRAAGPGTTTEDSHWSPAATPPGTGRLPRTGPRGTGSAPVPDGPDPGGNLRDRDPGRTQETPLGPGGLPAGDAAGEPLAAQPGMVPLGIRDGNEISADLAAMGGLGLTGPGAPAAARAILAALLAQALPGQPSGPVEIIMTAADAAELLPGPHREDITAARLPGLAVTPALDQALDYAEALILRKARESGSHETGGPGEDAPARPLAAALIATPPRTSQRLRGVLESGRNLGVAGILLGDWPPGITCHVTADGVITSADPALDGIQMFHLDAADSTAVLRLMQAACGNPADSEDPPAPNPSGPPPAWGSGMATGGPRTITAATTQRAPTAESGTNPGHDIPAAAGTAPPAPAASGPAAPSAANPQHPGGRVIRVEVLGPLRITAGGQEIRGGLRKARELLAFLAVHPDGVTGEALSEALWPESAPGRGATQRNLALRKLRDMLRAAAGLTEPMLVTLTAERYRLDPAFITTDVAGFQAALEAARHAADDTARLAACQEAAALYRGPLADGAGYDWAEPYAEAARRRALDAWTRIAELLEPADADQALAALETALGHDPFNEYLYQRIMRLQAAAGRPDAVRRTLRLLETRLTEIGVTPGTQTRQAAAALLGMPGPPPRGGPQPPAAPRPAATARQRPPGHHPAR